MISIKRSNIKLVCIAIIFFGLGIVFGKYSQYLNPSSTVEAAYVGSGGGGGDVANVSWTKWDHVNPGPTKEANHNAMIGVMGRDGYVVTGCSPSQWNYASVYLLKQ